MRVIRYESQTFYMAISRSEAVFFIGMIIGDDVTTQTK